MLGVEGDGPEVYAMKVVSELFSWGANGASEEAGRTSPSIRTRLNDGGRPCLREIHHKLLEGGEDEHAHHPLKPLGPRLDGFA